MKEVLFSPEAPRERIGEARKKILANIRESGLLERIRSKSAHGRFIDAAILDEVVFGYERSLEDGRVTVFAQPRIASSTDDTIQRITPKLSRINPMTTRMTEMADSIWQEVDEVSRKAILESATDYYIRICERGIRMREAELEGIDNDEKTERYLEQDRQYLAALSLLRQAISDDTADVAISPHHASLSASIMLPR